MQNYHLHLQGQVQGVGFRPFVFQLAQEYKLRGWVLNGPDGVHIEVRCSTLELDRFAALLRDRAPRLARITAVHIREVPHREYDAFEIVHSTSEALPNLLISPDFALCPECRQELATADNRRFGYPFITCTSCGPRYSIMASLPYDRERTAMAPFALCPACAEEYNDPLDRRYYSQTNSCGTCGIQLGWFYPEGGGYAQDSETVLKKAVKALAQGHIVAVKGVGGFLLMADATQEKALQTLRQRKHRPSKPFALLYPDLARLQADVALPAQACEALLGPVSPIVLVPLKENPESPLALEAIAPGLGHLGIMLPYAPLLQAIASAFPNPLVATSGNISHAPIVFEEEKARTDLMAVADFVLSHNRPILSPQDDSVLRFSPLSGQPIWLRRSRGLAPTLLLEAARQWSVPVLAMGADLKSAFALLSSGNTYVSQYLGDLDSWETQQHFKHTLDHLLGLCGAKPEAVLADLHPGYFSHTLGRELSDKWRVPFHVFQHHTAHFGAILAEHGLFAQEEPILGVVLDGTGWGADGQVWGAEFFRYSERKISRIGHFSYFPHLAGDKMARDPRLCALSLTLGQGRAEAIVAPLFSRLEWGLYQQLAAQPGGMKTSSAGRLFDGIAALCGLAARNTFEGEAAMQLEQAALSHFQERAWQWSQRYPVCMEGAQVALSPLLEAVLQDLEEGIAPAQIAAAFHIWIVDAIAEVAFRSGVAKLAFSGGVFQNAVLVELLIQKMSGTYTLYFHEALSPNDENISLGQMALFEENIPLAG